MGSNYIVHTVRDGDTIQLIARNYNVDWTELVVLNGLEYPYVDTDIRMNESENNDSVAKLGSNLLIPSVGLNFPIKSNSSIEEVEKYAFGCDLDLFSYDSEGHNEVVNLDTEGQLTDDSNGDIKLSEGIKNLKQQLIIRLGTEKGALSLHPEFGSDLKKLIGSKVTPELLTKARLKVIECLQGDFRVQQVEDVKVSFTGGIYVECRIIPISPYSPFTLSHMY